MTLIIYNTTASPLIYASGLVVVPASGTLTVPVDLHFETIDDPQFRADIANGIAELDDGVRHYAGTDATAFADYFVGLKDADGQGLTSTEVITGVTTHQALDVNIVSGTSTGSSDISSFTYGDTVFQAVGGVFNDVGATVPPGFQAAVRITDQRALHTNLRDDLGQALGVPGNPLTVDAVINVADTITTLSPPVLSQFSEVTGVVMGVTTLVGSYTAVANRKFQKVAFSGNNTALYELLINGATADKKYTYFGSTLNGEFNFDGGLVLTAGDLIEVYVVHSRPDPGDFSCRIQLLEITP